MSGLLAGKDTNETAPELDSIIRSIVRYRKPARILLFGSRARRDARPDSDIDICVLFDTLPKRQLEVLQDLYRELYDTDAGPVDLLVYDEAAFRDRASRPHSFEAKILDEGISIYGQA